MANAAAASTTGDQELLTSLQAFMNDIAEPAPRSSKKRSNEAEKNLPDAKRMRGKESIHRATPTTVVSPTIQHETAAANSSGPIRLQAAPTNHRIDDMFHGRHRQVAAEYAAKQGPMTAASVKRAAAASAATKQQPSPPPKSAAQRAAQAQNVSRYIQDDQLGKEQLRGVRMIMDASGTRLSGRHCFISGAGGCGKSYLIAALIQRWKRHSIRFKITATTGVAASLIRGMTFHSLMKMGLMRHPINKLRLLASRNKELIAEWKDLQVLIIDEVGGTCATRSQALVPFPPSTPQVMLLGCSSSPG
jgi:ABC-type glutathione transport system ATPase component